MRFLTTRNVVAEPTARVVQRQIGALLPVAMRGSTANPTIQHRGQM